MDDAGHRARPGQPRALGLAGPPGPPSKPARRPPTHESPRKRFYRSLCVPFSPFSARSTALPSAVAAFPPGRYMALVPIPLRASPASTAPLSVLLAFVLIEPPCCRIALGAAYGVCALIRTYRYCRVCPRWAESLSSTIVYVTTSLPDRLRGSAQNGPQIPGRRGPRTSHRVSILGMAHY